ncbi:MAG: phosphotransferase family protein [bacterium]
MTHTSQDAREPNPYEELILVDPTLQLTNVTPELQVMQGFLQHLVSGKLVLENLKLIWMKNNPLEGLRLLYQAESPGSQRRPYYFFARTMSPKAGKEWQEKMNRQFLLDIQKNKILSVFQKAAVYSPALGMLVQIFPADRRLPFLIPATDSEVMKPVLEHICGDEAGKLTHVDVAVVQYKPERKCLLRYQLHWQDSREPRTPTQSVYGKVFRKVKRVYANLETIHQAWYNSVFQIPTPLGLVPEFRLELLSALPGTQLSYVCGRKTFPDLCRRVARGLLDFHETPVLLNETKSLSDELLELKAWGQDFGQSRPDEWNRIRNSIFTLEMRLLGQNRLKPKLVHGDFHVANILVDGQRLSLLDFENCLMGNPAIDVGSFYAQLKLLALKRYQNHTALDHGVRAFLKTYIHGCSEELRAVIPTYCALSCLWCAYFQCILRPVKAGWMERAYAMLALCEQILDSGEPAGVE